MAEWTYSATLRRHRRFYRGTKPLDRIQSYGVVEKTDGHYAWALFLHGKPSIYGEAPTLLAAKRAADRAEVGDRLSDAASRLERAKVEYDQARAEHRAIVDEMRRADGSGRARPPKE